MHNTCVKLHPHLINKPEKQKIAAKNSELILINAGCWDIYIRSARACVHLEIGAAAIKVNLQFTITFQLMVKLRQSLCTQAVSELFESWFLFVRTSQRK